MAEKTTEEAEVKLIGEGKVGSTTQEEGRPESNPEDSELRAENVRVNAAGSQVIGVWKRTSESESVVAAEEVEEPLVKTVPG